MNFDAHNFVEALLENDDEIFPTLGPLMVTPPTLLRLVTPCDFPAQSGHLLGKCRYIHFPSFIFQPSTYSGMASGPRDLVRLFVGQTTYYATPRVLRWVVYEVCRVIVRYVQPMRAQPAAFFYLHVRTVEDRDRIILAMHKRVLFDAYGVWVAEDFEQATAMAAFISTERRVIVPMVPLPRESMVVEAIRGKPACQ